VSPFLSPAVGAAVLAGSIDCKSPTILVDAQLHTAQILRRFGARDYLRRSPITQVVFAIAHGDRVVAKPGPRVDAVASRWLGGKLSFARVSSVLAKVLVLCGLHGEQSLDSVAAAFSQRVRSPHDHGDRRQHRDRHERRNNLSQREAARD